MKPQPDSGQRAPQFLWKSCLRNVLIATVIGAGAAFWIRQSQMQLFKEPPMTVLGIFLFGGLGSIVGFLWSLEKCWATHVNEAEPPVVALTPGRSLVRIPDNQMQWTVWMAGACLMLAPGIHFLWLLVTGGGVDGPVIFGLIGLFCLMIGFGIRLLGERQGVLIDPETAIVCGYSGWLGNDLKQMSFLSEVSGVAVRYELFDDPPDYCIELVKADGSRLSVGERRLKFDAVRTARKISEVTGLPLLLEC